MKSLLLSNNSEFFIKL